MTRRRSSEEESRGIFTGVIIIHENKVVKVNVVKYDVRHVRHKDLLRVSLVLDRGESLEEDRHQIQGQYAANKLRINQLQHGPLTTTDCVGHKVIIWSPRWSLCMRDLSP
jgi:hypothetical protein